MRGTDSTTGKPLEGLAHLRQSIRDILTTPLGSRVMRRDYGSRLFDLVDAPLNAVTKAEIFAAAAEALIRWEPRLLVQRVQASRITSTANVSDTIDLTTLTISGITSPSAANGSYLKGEDSNGYQKWEKLDGIFQVLHYPDGSTSQTWVILQNLGLLGVSLFFTEESVSTPNKVKSWITPGSADRGKPLLSFSASTNQKQAATLSMDKGSIVIDLEAIYLPTGSPVFLDGIAIS